MAAILTALCRRFGNRFIPRCKHVQVTPNIDQGGALIVIPRIYLTNPAPPSLLSTNLTVPDWHNGAEQTISLEAVSPAALACDLQGQPRRPLCPHRRARDTQLA
jgi:hypothetical protein